MTVKARLQLAQQTLDPRAIHLATLSKSLGEQAKNTKWYEMSERLIPILRRSAANASRARNCAFSVVMSC